MEIALFCRLIFCAHTLDDLHPKLIDHSEYQIYSGVLSLILLLLNLPQSDPLSQKLYQLYTALALWLIVVIRWFLVSLSLRDY